MVISLEDLQKVLNLIKVKEEAIFRGYSNIVELASKEIQKYEDCFHFVILNNSLVTEGDK